MSARAGKSYNGSGRWYLSPSGTTDRPPLRFNQDVSLLDATLEQLAFVDAEPAKLVATGAWERFTTIMFVSRLFLVQKPVNIKWGLIYDLRHMND
jgi:hypothetical protein